MINLPETDDLLNSLMSYDIVYLSAITLSIYERGRARAPVRGESSARACSAPDSCSRTISAPGDGRIAMSREVPSARGLRAADIVLASTEDLLAALSRRKPRTLMAHIPARSGVQTRRAGEPAAVCRGTIEVQAEPMTKPVVDTTAAGDSFAAAYVAARLSGPRSRSRPRAPAIVLPASWCAIPAPSFRAMPCRRRKRPDPRFPARHPNERDSRTPAANSSRAVEGRTVIPVLTIERLEDAVPLAPRWSPAASPRWR